MSQMNRTFLASSIVTEIAIRITTLGVVRAMVARAPAVGRKAYAAKTIRFATFGVGIAHLGGDFAHAIQWRRQRTPSGGPTDTIAASAPDGILTKATVLASHTASLGRQETTRNLAMTRPACIGAALRVRAARRGGFQTS